MVNITIKCEHPDKISLDQKYSHPVTITIDYNVEKDIKIAFEKQQSYSYRDNSFTNFRNGYLAGLRRE